MRSPSRIVLLVLAFASVCAPLSARAQVCISGTGAPFRYCGAHVPLADLPFRFAINTAGEPAAVAGQTLAAAQAAALEWNSAWPVPSADSPACPLICITGTTSHGLSKDGVNTILWGSPSGCGQPDGIAAACPEVISDAPDGSTRIGEYDIVLASSVGWKASSDPAELASGLARLGYLNDWSSGTIANVTWHDLQSVLAHELGHAIGLLDLTDCSDAWQIGTIDTTATETAQAAQVMYCYYVGSTNKRALGAGDASGVQLIAAETLADGFA